MPDAMLPPPRTYLFVPGTRPERFGKALASGADRVVLDLEDAVAADDKASARSAIATWLQGATPAGRSRMDFWDYPLLRGWPGRQASWMAR